MSSEQGYQGWTNYETWCVNLWLSNEEPSQRYWAEMAQAAWDASEPSAYLTREQEAVRALADTMKDELEEAAPELTGLYADLLTTALGAVDWVEIATAWMEDIDKAAPPEAP